MREAQKELKQLRELPPTVHNVQRMQMLKQEINDLLQREEIMWLQRSRVQWLKGGDQNTDFFHARASVRKKKNKINRLQDDEGNWHSEFNTIYGVAQKYFHHLFTMANPNRIEECVDNIDNCLS